LESQKSLNWLDKSANYKKGKDANRSYANVVEMDRSLIDNWNQSIGKEDHVFFLGDFGLGDVGHFHFICSQLNVQKIFIRGNHNRNAS